MIAAILDIMEQYDLGGCVRWILENNPSQALPYHNFNHSLWVAYHAHEAYLQSTDGKNPPKELILAALFHDFGHSGGFFADDSKNVEAAISGFMRWIRQTNAARNTDVHVVHYLIRLTKYPFELPETDLYHILVNQEEYSLQLNCLRDADMMQNCNDTLLSNFVGVKQELFRHDSYAEYTEKTLVFLRGIEYETQYGKEVGQPLLNMAIEQMEWFQRLLFAELNGQRI